MVEFKLTINDVKTGKSYKKIVRDLEADVFRGKKIKDQVLGNEFGLKDYELEITGGSDNAGFPMRSDLDLMGRKRILIVKGQGAKLKRIGVLSFSIFQAAFSAVIGVLVVIFMKISLASLPADSLMVDGQIPALTFGNILLIILQMAAAGFVFGLIFAWIYNLFAKYTGGIELDLTK